MFADATWLRATLADHYSMKTIDITVSSRWVDFRAELTDGDVLEGHIKRRKIKQLSRPSASKTGRPTARK